MGHIFPIVRLDLRGPILCDGEIDIQVENLIQVAHDDCRQVQVEKPFRMDAVQIAPEKADLRPGPLQVVRQPLAPDLRPDTRSIVGEADHFPGMPLDVPPDPGI